MKRLAANLPSRIVALLVLSMFSAQATEQLYRTYNMEDLDSDGFFGGATTATTPFTPSQRSDLPIDIADAIGGESFNPAADDAAIAADNLDNNLDGDIDGDSPSAPSLSVYDFAIEIPGNFIDDDGDFQTDEPPSPTNPIGSGIVRTMVSGEILKLGYRAVEAYTTLQAFPTGAMLTGGFEPLIPSDDASFADFYGNLEWTAGDPGIWLFRIFAFNGAGIDSVEFMVEVLPGNQPDAQVGPGIGNNVYNATGSGQAVNLTSRKARAVSSRYLIENDGALDDSFTVRGTPGNSIFVVSYTSSTAGNVTAQIASGSYSTMLLSNSENETITSVVRPKRAKVRKLVRKKGKKRKIRWKKRTYVQRIYIESQGDPMALDACLTVVRHR